IQEEGGYTNDPRDKGGETKWGISKRAYPHLDIPNLTIDECKVLYKQDYWLVCRCDQLPAQIAVALFDSAVNAGPTQAVKWLQRAVHGTVDGIVGPETLRLANEADPLSAAQELLARRLEFYGNLSTFKAFGLGWCRRTLRLLNLICRA